MQKKNILGGNFYLFYEKSCFSGVFLLFKASVRSRPPWQHLVPVVFVAHIINLNYFPFPLTTVCPKGDDKSKLPCVSFITILTGLCLDLFCH